MLATVSQACHSLFPASIGDGMSESPQSKGGAARAQKLTSEERKAIAKRAAEARWAKIEDPDQLPVATHQGELQIGDVLVEVYRLKDNRRMIAKAAMARALNLKSAGGNAFLRTITRQGIRGMISDDLWERIENPKNFRRPTTDLQAKGSIVDGYEGSVLIDVCGAIIDAHRQHRLAPSQEFLAAQSEIIIRSAAKLGIVALIDEAVGFEDRRKDEYKRLFEAFIREEFRQWEAEFPDSFFSLMYRLHGLKRENPDSNKHPQFFGHFIRKFVYYPLANSNGAILEALEDKNPVVYEGGGRRRKFFQYLTDEIGINAFRQHLWKTIGIGEASMSKAAFERNFYRAFPQSAPLGGLQIEMFDD
jgi:hypothetical protein